MFFLWTQYRILKKVIMHGYRYAAPLSPKQPEIKVFLCSQETVSKHLRVLERQGMIRFASFSENEVPYTQVTDKGIDYFFSIKRSIVHQMTGLFIAISASVISSFFSYRLGLEQGFGKQETYQYTQNNQCCMDEMKTCFVCLIHKTVPESNLVCSGVRGLLHDFLKFLLLIINH